MGEVVLKALLNNQDKSDLLRDFDEDHNELFLSLRLDETLWVQK